MSGPSLHLWLRYTVSTDELLFATDVKDEAIAELVSTFLQTEIGSGEDKTPPEDRDVYNIRLRMRMEDDTFFVKHDCGNLGFRDGILLKAVEKFQGGTAKRVEPDVLYPKARKSEVKYELV